MRNILVLALYTLVIGGVGFWLGKKQCPKTSSASIGQQETVQPPIQLNAQDSMYLDSFKNLMEQP